MNEILLIFGMCVGVLIIVRAQWVGIKRHEILSDNAPANVILKKYDTYLNFHKMMLMFWVWNIEKLKK